MLQVVREFWQQVQAFLDWVFHVIALIWAWSVEQIMRLPWQDLNSLPPWKTLLLLAAALCILVLVFWIAREVLRVGAQLIAAVVTLLGVIVRTLPAMAAAGLIAAGAAYVINNVSDISVLEPESPAAAPPQEPQQPQQQQPLQQPQQPQPSQSPPQSPQQSQQPQQPEQQSQ